MDWGLGHATRMVPVIDLLMKNGAKVIIGADNRPLDYLRSRFPDCDSVCFPGFTPKYPENGKMAFAMIKSYPEMLRQAKSSKKMLEKLIQEKGIDIIISDNRYELSSKNAWSVFITHQLNIQTPGLAELFNPLIRAEINRYIRKYDELWIPDYEGNFKLSGHLTEVDEMPVQNHSFVGPLSRFPLVEPVMPKEHYDLMVILSGPEPQRTILERILHNQLIKTNLKAVVLQGQPEHMRKRTDQNMTYYSHLHDAELAGLIKDAGLIISRPGYTTIMDLAVFGKKAIFIPTPGQTEQEYLGKRYHEMGICYSAPQSNFNLDEALQKASNYKGFTDMEKNTSLKAVVEKLMTR